MKNKNIIQSNISLLVIPFILLPSLMQNSIASTNVETLIFELNDVQMDNINAGDAATARANAFTEVSSVPAHTVTTVGTVVGSTEYINYSASYSVAVGCCNNQHIETTAETFVTGDVITTSSNSQNTDYSSVAWSISVGYSTN